MPEPLGEGGARPAAVADAGFCKVHTNGGRKCLSAF